MTTSAHPLVPNELLFDALQAASLARAPVKLRIVRDEAGFMALHPSWDKLLQCSAVRTPFMTWDWVTSWYQQHRDHCQLCIGVLDDFTTGEPVALAPLVISRPLLGPRKTLRHLTFMGTVGEGGSQGMDFIVPAGKEEQLTPQLTVLFKRTQLRWDVIDLPTMHEESPNLPFLRSALARHAQAGERSAPQNSYLMSLAGSWEDQMATWKSKERVSFRTKWRKLIEEHNGRLLQGGIDYPAEQAFDELWRLHALRFEGQHSSFLSEQMRQLHRSLVARWSADGRAMLPLIEADGRIVAARYGFAMNGRYWSYQTGYDPAYSKLSVGILSLGWTAQCAIARGLHEIDHLPGEARYKSEWSTHTRRVVHLETFNRLSLTGAVFRLMRGLKRRHTTGKTEPSVNEETAR